MRLVSFFSGKDTGWAVLTGGGMVDARRLGDDLPATLLTGIERAPYIPRPGKVTCLGGTPVANCSTLRDYPRRPTQWTIGKNFDGTGSFGPCLVTADELPAGCTGLHIESRLSKPGHAECKYLRDGLRRGTHDFPVVRMPDAGAWR